MSLNVSKGTEGLPNIGNTCFLNSLIQFFYSARKFRELIIESKYQNQGFWYNLSQIMKCISNKSSDQKKKIILKKLAKDLQNMDDGYNFGQQYDSKNVYFGFLNKLKEQNPKFEKCLDQLFQVRYSQSCINCQTQFIFTQFYVFSEPSKCSCGKNNVFKLKNTPEYLIMVNQSKEAELNLQVLNQERHLSYKLVGGIDYHGSGLSGHYTSYRYQQSINRWCHISDNSTYLKDNDNNNTKYVRSSVLLNYEKQEKNNQIQLIKSRSYTKIFILIVACLFLFLILCFKYFFALIVVSQITPYRIQLFEQQSKPETSQLFKNSKKKNALKNKKKIEKVINQKNKKNDSCQFLQIDNLINNKYQKYLIILQEYELFPFYMLMALNCSSYFLVIINQLNIHVELF